MKNALLFIFIATLTPAFSQDKSIQEIKKEASRVVAKDLADTVKWRWKKGGLINLNLAQGSLKNWAAGGDDFSLSVNSFLNYFLLYKNGRHNWDNNIDFNFGFIQTTSLGSRKNDDRFDALSKYGYGLSDKWFLTGLFNFRTQFFDGYTYPNPGQQVFSSTFLSPAYVLLSAGMDYKPNANFSAFISPVTVRWIIVADEFLAAKGLYGVAPGKRAITEIGAFASLNYNKGLGKNVSYKAKLDLFSNYRHKPQNIDVFMTNFLSFKVNKYLSATYNLDLIYDDDVRLFGDDGKSAGTQVKSLVGIGFLMRFQ